VTFARRTAQALAILALLSPLWLAQPSAAQSREFAGRVIEASPDALSVKDRRANIVKFTRGPKTTVEGKSSWESIVVGDQVIVLWRLGDGTARRVTVIEKPPQDH
jgi:hypothetical protein